MKELKDIENKPTVEKMGGEDWLNSFTKTSEKKIKLKSRYWDKTFYSPKGMI